MSKSFGRVFGIGEETPYGYETDYMQYLQGYNPYDYEQTLRNMMASAVNENTRPPYQIRENQSLMPSYSGPTKAYSPSNSPADMLYKDWLITNEFLNKLKQINANKDSVYQPYNWYEWNTNAYDVSQTATNDYTVNTENLLGKPNSYIHNNNVTSNWESDSGVNYPQQTTTPTPWSNLSAQISPVPWRNNQTLTPWAGGYDLSVPAHSSGNYISDEDLYAKM